MIQQLLRPWRRQQTWWSLSHVLLDLVVGTVTFTIIVTLLTLSVSLLIVFPLAVVFIWLLFFSSRVLAALERSRFAALLDIHLITAETPRADTRWGRFLAPARSKARWLEIAYLLLLLPLGLLNFVVVTLAWCGSAALVGLPVYVSQLPGGTAKFWLFEVGSGPPAILAALVGLVGLVLVAPWATTALAHLDAAAGRRFLGGDQHDALEERVTELETSRSAAVDSAEAERRRIERDLHDGAQARLVALAMDLGVARERLEVDPDAGRELVGEAHDEVKAALKELRDLVRGIHPVILEDRGLDAALSAVVARSPVPVTLQVDLDRRLAPAVESTAYFVVSEALTNVARHAEANSASVSIARRGDRLVIEIRDDGIGGADGNRGTGLRGLNDRATSLGGWMQVVSPPGGPTTLLVEVPCGS